MKKRTVTAALLLLILFAFCSCSHNVSSNESASTAAATQEPETTVKTDNDDFTDKYTAVKLSYGYEGLENDCQRQFYKAMEEKAALISEQVSDSDSYLTEEIFIPGDIQDRDIFIALTAFKYDNPGTFWLKESFTSSSINGGVSIRLCSYFSAEELTLKKQEFDNKVKEILSPVESGLSEYELELYIHDYLLENCEYDSGAADEIYNQYSDDTSQSFTCYGALVLGKAICQGYADAMSYLLSCVGVENTEISGTSQGGNHIWNAVKIDGDWYYVDATWDDQGDEAYQYDYFNINESQLQKDHNIALKYYDLSDDDITGGESNLGCNFNIFIPDCGSSSYNYYVKNGAVLQGFDEYCDSEMAESLLQAVSSGQEYFHIYIDGLYLNYDYACEQLFDPYIYHFQSYVDIVNSQLGYNCIDTSAAIVKKESLDVITVKLSYL